MTKQTRQTIFDFDLVRLKIDTDISVVYCKHYFENQSFEVDKNCNLKVINTDKTDKKIKNRWRKTETDNRFVAHDFVYLLIDWFFQRCWSCRRRCRYWIYES